MKKKDVLRNRDDFSRLYNKGRSAGSRFLVLLCLENGLSFNRKAFLSSKKVGGSVERNRARRIMREAYRSVEEKLPQGYDLLFIARSTITEKDAGTEDIRSSMLTAFKRTGLL